MTYIHSFQIQCWLHRTGLWTNTFVSLFNKTCITRDKIKLSLESNRSITSTIAAGWIFGTSPSQRWKSTCTCLLVALNSWIQRDDAGCGDKMFYTLTNVIMFTYVPVLEPATLGMDSPFWIQLLSLEKLVFLQTFPRSTTFKRSIATLWLLLRQAQGQNRGSAPCDTCVTVEQVVQESVNSQQKCVF